LAASRPRPREVGVRLGLLPPGPLNAITDVPGVRVGHVSLVEGESVRTGVTALLTHARDPFLEKTPAAAFVLNGFGKMAGLAQVAELGVIETPIALTNTLSVPTAMDALIGWTLDRHPDVMSVNPVVGECNDGYLNDIRGRHVRVEHVLAALEHATGGPVAGGSVGAGVGMSCYGHKGGIGTASRVVADGLTIGALVLANFGRAEELRVGTVDVGRQLAAGARGRQPSPSSLENEPGGRAVQARDAGRRDDPRTGSVIVLIATDAPLDARQLGRVARRGGLGLARTGSPSGHGSGDFILAFSNAEPIPHRPSSTTLTRHVLAEDGPSIDRIFAASVESVEEAVIDALFRAETMVGRDGHVREALPWPIATATRLK
jgi:D-aminopeptidase